MLTPHRLAVSAVLATALVLTGRAAAQFTVVDVIPPGRSFETLQNSEPSVAMNPDKTNQGFLSQFDIGDAPHIYYLTQDAGLTWGILDTQNHGDTTVAWTSGVNGTGFRALLVPRGRIEVQRSFDPTTIPFAPIVASRQDGRCVGGGNNGGTCTADIQCPGVCVGGANVGLACPPNPCPMSSCSARCVGNDQPWIAATTEDGGINHIYVGFNDLSRATPASGGIGNGKTATVRFSTDAGTTWTNAILDPVVPGRGLDGPSVRLATRGKTVYAVFQQFNSAADPGGGDRHGGIIFRRDDNAGNDAFNDQNSTVSFNSNILIPFNATTLGQERLGSDLAIAVDPNGCRLYVAYAEVNGGKSQVHIALSTDNGVNWDPKKFSAPVDTGLPALAVAQNATVGFLYTRLSATGDLETHFTQFPGGDLGNPQDNILSRFPNAELVSQGDPFIGDYEGLEALGNQFYGVLSAANANLPGRFPQGVIFNRAMGVNGFPNGNPADESIDPFFFTVAATPPILDHFKCYRGNAPGVTRTVTLADQFLTTTASVRKPSHFCNPVDKNGEGIQDPTGHLMCHKVRDMTRFIPRDVLVRNQFGDQIVRVLKSDTICNPARKNGVPLSSVAGAFLDHFKCYKARGRAFAPQTVTLADQFATVGSTVLKLQQLCNPVDKDGSCIKRPANHLACYKIKDATTFVGQPVTVDDQFGTFNIKARAGGCHKPLLLCVPSEKNPPSTTTTVSTTSSTTTTTFPSLCCDVPPGSLSNPVPVCFVASPDQVLIDKCELLGGVVSVGVCDPNLEQCVPSPPVPPSDFCCECPVPFPPFPHDQVCFDGVTGHEFKCQPPCVLHPATTCGPRSEQCGGSPSGAFLDATEF